MKLMHRLLDYGKPWSLPHVAIFTGNPIIKRDGGIVMGRGAAKQVRDTYPLVARRMARAITNNPGTHLRFVNVDARSSELETNNQYIGWFKVKDHWQEPAKLELIEKSVEELIRCSTQLHPDYIYHMNYPGVGNGKLDEQAVSVYLDKLPDNVIIYR